MDAQAERQFKLDNLDKYIEKARMYYSIALAALYLVSFVSYIFLFLYVSGSIIKSPYTLTFLYVWITGIVLITLVILFFLITKVDKYDKVISLRNTTLNYLPLTQDFLLEYNKISKRFFFPK